MKIGMLFIELFFYFKNDYLNTFKLLSKKIKNTFKLFPLLSEYRI